MYRILVAIDFTEVTDEVISQALILNKALQGRLCVLHVDDSAPYAYSPKDEPEAEAPAAGVSSPAEKGRLEPVLDLLSKEGLEVDYRLLKGPAADSILTEAKAFGADMIVIGAHQHGKIYHCLFDDTTGSLIRRAPCPILVVPPQEKD